VTSPEKRLDRALSGKPDVHGDLDNLIQTAGEVQRGLEAETPDARRMRAMFVQGAAARSRPSIFRTLSPAIALGLALVVLALAGQQARPGQTLYSVHRVLDRVGLATSAEEEARDLIDGARASIGLAESLDEDARRSLALAVDALGDLHDASALLEHIEAAEAADLDLQIEALTDRATAVIADARAVLDEGAGDSDDDNSGPGSGDSDDDNSGPGSGDDSDGDSSGPGSGDDSDDDKSGPGSGDDSDDDNSGPGSGDDSDDDNSGPGSGDDSDDDKSGSGSDDGSDNSGSGDGDSSGSGSDD
jgi:hypothetical protein